MRIKIVGCGGDIRARADGKKQCLCYSYLNIVGQEFNIDSSEEPCIEVKGEKVYLFPGEWKRISVHFFCGGCGKHYDLDNPLDDYLCPACRA